MDRYDRDLYIHLSDLQWDALSRMSVTVGADAIEAMLDHLDPNAQHASIARFIQSELSIAQSHISEMARQSQMMGQNQRRSHIDTLKVDVSKYMGVPGESLLRWLVELEAAMRARRIEEPSMQVTFAMSNLDGRAKTWAFGRRMGDPQCFDTYEELKQELRETYEPPKTEFRARSEFLSIKQGKRDIHAYAQHARLLISCIVSEPVDNCTQVVTFQKGLTDGPIKTHLFRMYPSTLEQAISLAIQEDFNSQQAFMHSAGYKPKAHNGVHQSSDGTEPMDLSYVNDGNKRRPQTKTQTKCHRCQKTGHFAYECAAAKPVARSGRKWSDSSSGKGPKKDQDKPKNGNSQ